MRRYSALVVAAGIVLVLAACTQAAKPSGGQTGSGSGKVPSAMVVWTETIANKGYKSWQTAPGYETTQAAKGPHGKAVQVFVDPNIAKTLSGPSVTAWPVGSMIAKDAYDATGTLKQVEFMQKTDQGWYFASFSADGNILTEGVKIAPCQPCHATGSDSVKSFKLP